MAERRGSLRDDVKKACLIRNQNEKKRRDRLSSLVSELYSYLPAPSKKLSKNNVLRYATECFRQEKLAARTENNNFKRIYGSWQPEFLTNEEFSQTMHIGLDEFLLVLNGKGNIVYVSRNVFSTLGYDADNLVNTSILDYVHKEDHFPIYSLLNVLNQSSIDNVPLQSSWFSCRLRCGALEKPASEFVNVQCISRIFRGIQGTDDTNECSCYVVLLGKIAFQPAPNRTVVTTDGNVSKFTARLNAKWRFECIERSATLTIGYYPFELLGTCLYEYCHSDDLANLAEYHSMLPYSGVITTCYYRLLTKGQVWIWVRSRCHVSYSQLDSKPESVICVTWPIKAKEFSKNQVEILERDRQLFSQILMKNEKKQVTTDSTNKQHLKEDRAAVSASVQGPGSIASDRALSSTNEAPCHVVTTEKPSLSSDSGAPPMTQLTLDRMTSGSSPAHSETPVTIPTSAGGQSIAKAWPVGADVDTVSVWQPIDGGYSSSGSVAIRFNTDVDENSLLLEDNVEIPNSLSYAQWALHVHLREQYKRLTESIRQQSEQISTIQRQLSIQKELSELSEQLEMQQSLREQSFDNSFQETKEVIRQKMQELLEASYGDNSCDDGTISQYGSRRTSH